MKWAGRLLRGRTLDASLALAVALLAGRLSGLLREIELARTFGLSARADIAVLLLTLPDLLVGLLLAGGISAALVPRFRLLDEVAGAMLFRRAALFAGAGFGFAGLILAVAPGAMFAVFAPGITHLRDMLPAQASLAVALALPLTALSGVVTALLNARDRYFIAGLGTLVFNLSVIAGLLLGGPPERMLANLGLAIALGALIRLLSQIAIVPREVWRQHSLEGYSDRAVASAFVAGVGATGLALLAPILVRAAASLLGSGAVAAFNYAQKLTELPVGILITTISTVALTVFSRLVAEQNEAALRQAVGRRLRYGLLIGVTVMVFGLLFADPFVRFLLGGGGARWT